MGMRWLMAVVAESRREPRWSGEVASTSVSPSLLTGVLGLGLGSDQWGDDPGDDRVPGRRRRVPPDPLQRADVGEGAGAVRGESRMSMARVMHSAT